MAAHTDSYKFLSRSDSSMDTSGQDIIQMVDDLEAHFGSDVGGGTTHPGLSSGTSTSSNVLSNLMPPHPRDLLTTYHSPILRSVDPHDPLGSGFLRGPHFMTTKQMPRNSSSITMGMGPPLMYGPRSTPGHPGDFLLMHPHNPMATAGMGLQVSKSDLSSLHGEPTIHQLAGMALPPVSTVGQTICGSIAYTSNPIMSSVDLNSVMKDGLTLSRAQASAAASAAVGAPLYEIDDNGFAESLVIDTNSVKSEPGTDNSCGTPGNGGQTICAAGGYPCAECGEVFKSRGALRKHISKNHAPVPEPVDLMNKLYSCGTCSYSTPRRDKLDKHMAKHLSEGLSPSGKKRSKPTPPQRIRHAAEEYRCHVCPYHCTVEKAYKKHLRQHQQAIDKPIVYKQYSCRICGKDRVTEAELRKHMKKHRDGNDYTCDICGFASVQLKKVVQHRRMHTGEKPHLCPHCSYRSARRDNLRSHVRRMHKKENMYIDTFSPRNLEPTHMIPADVQIPS